MRHRKIRSKLSMMTAHRNATVRNIVRALIKHQRIQTTVARAKVARRLAERLITLSKQDTVTARRRAYAVLTDRDMVAKLFNDVAPLFKERKSGYTRIIPLNFRRGDGASLAILELTDKKMIEKLAKKKVKAKPEAAKAESAPKPEEGEAKREPAQEHKKEAKKEEPRVRPLKAKPTLDEEKKTEKARSEDRKIVDKKGFIKNLRGFFRRKTDM